ncbi:MAG: TrmB family transcriptional regulator [Candidatus Levyibacteriota bacterium]
MDTILAYLRQLDLSEVEAKLYLTLLQTGPNSIRDLAHTINIKRTNAYFYIDQLTEKGLIMKLVKGSRKMVAANDPESLKTLVEKKIASAEETKKDFNQIFSMLDKKIPEDRNFDKGGIRYYKGKMAIKKFYEESLQGPELRIYVNLSQLDTLLAKSNFVLPYDIYERALEKNKNLKIYEIIADEPGTLDQFELSETTNRNDRYQYKYMPKSIGLTSPGMVFFNNTVAIISGQNEAYITVWENADYYENSVKLFAFVWNVLPEPGK